MAIVAGFDVHRVRITFDALDTETGEVHGGRIAADPESVRGWVGRFEGRRVDVAVEACTGWLLVCEALREAGAVAHLAETDETHARRGKKRRAKTDRADARWLRTPLGGGPASRGLDPARPGARVAHPYPPAKDARRRAHRLA